MITIYHNPRCSKSREALAQVQAHAERVGTSLTVVDYQKTPLDLAQLRELQAKLGVPVREMVRTGEDAYAELQLNDADDDALLAALAAHPILLQRPVVVSGERALIARPPADLNVFLG
ncbi:arsenate reductase (glutaredoxin) [Oxalobacteraceae bacterium OM1]|nr:arsenate reductase (glutaredoxin) [Oxalobacteraceae bacterium OM1]